MKTESGTQPKPYRITVVGNDAHIEFAENVQSVKTDDGTKYVYDSYMIKTRNTANLAERIDKNVSAWIAKAKGIEAAPVKPDPMQEKIDALEARLAKVEGTTTVKAELVAISDPIIKDPIVNK